MSEKLPLPSERPQMSDAMHQSRWHAIWSKRQRDGDGAPTLAELLALDGFDILGGVTVAAFRAHCDYLAVEMDLRAGETIFDVGCGAGAFLYPFHEQGHGVGGLDYAANLVQIAATAMPGADVQHGEAAMLESEPPFDAVVAHGSFLYFPDHAYAAAVLQRMVRKARRHLAILDVPDQERQAEALAARQATLGPEEYARKYSGLDHLNFERDWFAKTLSAVDCTITVKQQSMPGYLHNPYRFNVFVHLNHAGSPEG